MHKVHVLLIEDQADIRDILSCALDRAGFEVSVVTDCRIAFAAVVSRAVDALLIDVDADPDGWSLARRAREISATLPVIYLARDIGPAWDGVPLSVLVTKPFAPAQIVEALGQLTARSNDPS